MTDALRETQPDVVARTSPSRAGKGPSTAWAQPAPTAQVRRFATFRLDAMNQRLWRDDVPVEVPPKTFAVLRYLVEHPGRLVTQRELLEALWPETYVQPEVLKTYIRNIRKLLGDDPRAPRFIETRARRGYRFIAAVADESLPPLAAAPAGSRARTPVGREAALSQLGDALTTASRGARQVVFVTGEAGIGKTALVEAFQEQAVTRAPLWIAASQSLPPPHGAREPYDPILDALGQWCRGPGGDAVAETLARNAPTWLVRSRPWSARSSVRRSIGSSSARPASGWCGSSARRSRSFRRTVPWC